MTVHSAIIVISDLRARKPTKKQFSVNHRAFWAAIMKYVAIYFIFVSLGTAIKIEDVDLTELLLDENPEDFPDETVQQTMEISPGTKWCGETPVADDENDFGKYEETDRCCRDHTLYCKTILSGETKWSLENTHPFFVSECSCDEKFLECLQNSNDQGRSEVEFDFFGILHPPCFVFKEGSEEEAEWHHPIPDPYLAQEIKDGNPTFIEESNTLRPAHNQKI